MKLFLVAILLLTLVVAESRKRQNGKGRLRNGQIKNLEDTCNLAVSCKSDSKFPVHLPIRGPKGPSGPPGEKGEPGSSGTPGIPGIPGRSQQPTKVAFFAGLEKNVGAVEENSDIQFNSILSNVGNAYNKNTGRFTAPVNGTYFFTAVVSAQGGQRAAAMIVKNGMMLVTVWAESFPSWGTASNSVVLDLKMGDQVWLIQLKRAPYLHGYMYSTFSGMILFSGL